MARNESLSSTSRIVPAAVTTALTGQLQARGDAELDDRSPEPTRRNAGFARLFFDIGDGFGLLDDFLVHTIELGHRALARQFELRALRGIVAIDEIGRERIDAALQGVGEDAAAPERRTRGSNARPPVSFVLDRRVRLGLAARKIH